MYVTLLFLFLALAAQAATVKPANFSDVAGDYRLMKKDAALCTPTMQIRTSGTEIIALKFENYPLKCNLPWKLRVTEILAVSKMSSTIGTTVTTRGWIKCRETTLKPRAFRALRDHDYKVIGASNPVPVYKGNFYIELGTGKPIAGGRSAIAGSCMYGKITNAGKLAATSADAEINPSAQQNSDGRKGSNGAAGPSVVPKPESQTEESGLSPEVIAAIISSIVGLIGVVVAALIGVHCISKRKASNETNDVEPPH